MVAWTPRERCFRYLRALGRGSLLLTLFCLPPTDPEGGASWGLRKEEEGEEEEEGEMAWLRNEAAMDPGRERQEQGR